MAVHQRTHTFRKKPTRASLYSTLVFFILRDACHEEISRMSTAWWLLLVAVTWSTVGLAVALVIGRIFRDPSPLPEEVVDRLIC
jgi:hypothetical protein